MISNPNTVFILGAGASAPYGFPVASGLRKYIIENFPNMINRYYRDVGPIDNAQRQIAERDALNFIKAFKLSDNISIDLFLSRNPRFLDIGKQAIILSILNFERKSKFRENCENPKHNWYTYLFSKMTKMILRAEEYSMIVGNNYSFITFNYDRSWEKYLYESFENSFTEIKSEDKNKVISKIPVIHIYGRIDYLNTIPYGHELGFNFIRTPIKNIRTPFEPHDLSTVYSALRKANRIIFLGFAYAEENMKLLNLQFEINEDCEIICSSYGLTNNETSQINTKFFKGLRSHFCNNEWDNVEVLKQRLDYASESISWNVS